MTTVPQSLVFVRGLATHLASRGFDVSAISSPGPDLTSFGEAVSAKTFGVYMPRSITPIKDIRAIAKIVAILRGLRPVIVHAHTPKGGLLGMVAAAIARVPARVYHMRGLPFTGKKGAIGNLLLMTEWISCRLAHRVICVSHSLRDVAIQARLCPPEKIVVLAGGSGQGVDARDRFNPNHTMGRREARMRLEIPDDATVIGFVGRIVRDKGVVELGSAWRTLRERHGSAFLLLVGPLESQDPVPEDVLNDLRADDRVMFWGMDWDTPSLYAAMDIVVLPSYREGFPNVPLEAAAMCLPVVATRVPGCIDAVADGVTGTLVPPRNSEELADALDAYITRPDLRRVHGHAGRARVEQSFGQEAIWEATHREYVDLLRHRLDR